jgi:hypothetical protein
MQYSGILADASQNNGSRASNRGYRLIEAGSGGVASLARGSLRPLRVISERSIRRGIDRIWYLTARLLTGQFNRPSA